MSLELHVTLWPSFAHFPRFADDKRLAGIRLNSAMMSNPELDEELQRIGTLKPSVPLFFDVKGRQLRVAEINDNPSYLDLTLNHPISVKTPVVVSFKAGADRGLLGSVAEDGRRLVFQANPHYMVKPGESLHIRHPSLQVHGPLFTRAELSKIEKTRAAGFRRYYLSYVESQRDVDQFLELTGRDVELMLKIENKKGLEFVANGFRKRSNLRLLAARGDLYIEIDKPHEILGAMKLIIEKDKEACAGSRFLLSVLHESIIEAFNVVARRDPDKPVNGKDLLAEARKPGVPSCADWHELAWLYDIGYRSVLLCDEICLDGDLLATAVNAFESFRQSYALPDVAATKPRTSVFRSVADALRGRR